MGSLLKGREGRQRGSDWNETVWKWISGQQRKRMEIKYEKKETEDKERERGEKTNDNNKTGEVRRVTREENMG